MKKTALMIVVLAIALSTMAALAEHPHRDWDQYMPLPAKERLAQPGTLRSPYIAFFPSSPEASA